MEFLTSCAIIILGLLNTFNCATFHWNLLDFDIDNTVKNNLITNGQFIQDSNVPFGIEIWRNKLFIAIPRRKSGVVATVSYIDLGTRDQSPLLKPYPNLASNQLSSGNSLISVYRMYVDTCDRLWFVDTGSAPDVNGNVIQYQPASIKVFDLKTNTLFKEYIFKPEDLRPDSSLTNLIVDITPTNACNDAFAYITDLLGFGLIVYSLKDNDSWRIKHPYFFLDPLSSDYNIGGLNFQWYDGIFGVALSSVRTDGYRTLFFHALSTTNEFAVSTKFLRNKAAANTSYHEYKIVGNRGINNQASSSAYHEKTNVLFYPLVNKNALACWNERRFNVYSEATNVILVQDAISMIYASDLRIDKEDNVWLITNRAPIAIFRTLNPADINFRIFKIPIEQIIKGTICDNKHSHSHHLNGYSRIYQPKHIFHNF